MGNINIPAQPFAEGKKPSASVLNSMADVARSIQNVAGASGVTANLLNGQLQISGIKNRPDTYANLVVAQCFNDSSEDDIEFGEIIMIQGSMYDEFVRTLDHPTHLKGSPCDFADTAKMHQAGKWAIALERIPTKSVGKVCVSGCCLARIWTPTSMFEEDEEFEDLFNDNEWRYVSERNNEKHLQIRAEENRGEILWWDSENRNETTGTVWGIVQFPVAPVSDLKVVHYTSEDSLTYYLGPYVLKIETDEGTYRHAEVVKNDVDCPLNVVTIDTNVDQDDYIVVNRKKLLGQPYDFDDEFPIGVSCNIAVTYDDVNCHYLYRGMPGYRVTAVNQEDPRYFNSPVVYFEVDHMPVIGIAKEDASATIEGEVTIAPCDYQGTTLGDPPDDDFIYMCKVVDTESSEGS